MKQQLVAPSPQSAGLWSYIQSDLLRPNAFLLPLRLFIGLGWLRAGVEKLIDPTWTSGDKLTSFFQTQMDSNAVYFPFYENLIQQLFNPNALPLSWSVAGGELLAGAAILTGTVTNLALLSALFMNVNFVLAGVVAPSAFYIIIQCALLATNVGATLGLDRFLSKYIPSFWIAAQPDFEQRQRSAKWTLLGSGIVSALGAAWVTPYIQDFGPHSIEDPAMLLFILLMLAAMLTGILFIRLTAQQPLQLPARSNEQSSWSELPPKQIGQTRI